MWDEFLQSQWAKLSFFLSFLTGLEVLRKRGWLQQKEKRKILPLYTHLENQVFPSFSLKAQLLWLEQEAKMSVYTYQRSIF